MGGYAKLNLGGGPVHQVGIACAAIVALGNGYAIAVMTVFRPGQTGDAPDLIIYKAERVRDNTARTTRWIKRSWRVEVIDSNDPVPDWTADTAKSAGYVDIVKIEIAKAKAGCNGETVPCVACLLEYCRERIP